MPKGVYNRKKSRVKLKRGRKVTAVHHRKSNEVKPVQREIARLEQAEVIMTFAGQVAGWHRQSLVLACTAAVAIIVGMHAKGKPIEQSDTVERLKKSINGRTGLHDAQVNKYIGLARALVGHLSMRFKVAGPIAEVLTATTPQVALDALTGYLNTQKVTTLEGLSIMFGKYRRTTTNGRTKAAERAIVKHAAGSKPPRIGSGNRAADAHAELALTLGQAPPDTLVLTAVQAGHSPMAVAEYAINLCTTDAELAHLEEVLASRGKQIAEHKAPAVASIADARRARSKAAA